MKKQFEVRSTIEVSASYICEIENSDQYLEAIGQIDLVQFNQPLYIPLENGKVLKLNIHDIEVVEQVVEAIEEE